MLPLFLHPRAEDVPIVTLSVAAVLLQSYAILINGIAWQINLIIPIDTCATCIQLGIFK